MARSAGNRYKTWLTFFGGTVKQLYRKQVLPIGLDEAWTFFSRPENLSDMTPPWLKFRIVSQLPEEMYQGMIIEYRITLPPGIPTTWVTEITQVREKSFFVDEQRLGPYRFWHHQHHYREVEGGVLAEDIVHYQVPFGILGEGLVGWYIDRMLVRIFDFRSEYLEKQAFADAAKNAAGKGRASMQSATLERLESKTQI